MTKFAGVAVFAFDELVFHDDAGADTGVDADVEHFIGIVAVRPFAQRGKIRLVFHHDGYAVDIAEAGHKIDISERRIRKKNDFVMMDNAMNAEGDAEKPVARLRESVYRLVNPFL